MKVIDLLNKIAKGEEVPKRIKYKGEVREYVYDDRDYVNSDSSNYYLFYNIITEGKGSDFANALNDEVEIIEDTPKEDRKIGKLRPYEEPFLKNGAVDTRFLLIIDQLSEIIDKINGDSNERNK